MLHISSLQKKIVFTIIIMAVMYSIFFLKVDLTRYRVFQQLWNFGHIVLFISLNYILYRKFLYKYKISIINEFIVIVILSLVIGYTIEIIQSYTGRDKSYYDVLLDVIGGMISFLLFSNSWKSSKAKIKYSFVTFIGISTLVAIYPMFNIVLDSYRQSRDFPTLVSNAYKSELTRFSDSNVIKHLVENEIDHKNENLLKVRFKKARYSTLDLKYFNQNWLDYNYLNFKVYNPNEKRLKLVISIYDKQHELSRFFYKDRFNTVIDLPPRWTSISINLNHLKNAPYNRKMNMQKIQRINIFMVNVRDEKVLFFDKIELLK